MWNQQPVRNLLANPTLETATVTQVVVRTNLAPCPRMTSSSMGTYNAVGTLATVTGISGGPDGITTALRVTYAAGANNPGVVVMPLPDVNSQYTVTAWVYNEGATSETIAIALKGFSSGGSTLVPQGVWTKLVWTLTTPGTLVTGNDFGVRIPTSTAAGSFLTTGVLIEKGVPATGTFFDGATTNGGDWTYVWNGTANASSSNQRGILPASIGVSGAAAIVHSVEWSASGGKSMRVIHTPSSTIAEAGLADIALVLPGKTYTIMGKLRLDKVATSSHSRSRRFNFYWSTNGGANYTEANGPQAANAIGVYDMRYTFTVPSDATNTLVRAGGHSWGNAGVLQADAWWDDLMLVEGEYTGDYVDGTKPFSKWDGTANASTSIGYPQWLYQIAGVPDVDVSSVGTTSLPGGYSTSEPRTLYTVWQNLIKVPTGQIDAIVYYGSTDRTDTVANTYLTLRIQASVQPGNGVLARRTGGGGPIDQNGPLGVGVVAYGTRANATMFLRVNGGTEYSDNSAMALPHQELVVLSDTTTKKHVRTLVYRGEHSDATKLAISRYLGNKYGAAIA